MHGLQANYTFFIGTPAISFKETLNKSFDRLRTNGKLLIPFVVSLSNHERNPLVQRLLNDKQGPDQLPFALSLSNGGSPRTEE